MLKNITKEPEELANSFWVMHYTLNNLGCIFLDYIPPKFRVFQLFFFSNENNQEYIVKIQCHLGMVKELTGWNILSFSCLAVTEQTNHLRKEKKRIKKDLWQTDMGRVETVRNKKIEIYI